jgi:hypothetical protein
MKERAVTTETTEQAFTHGLSGPSFPLVTPLAKKLWEIRQRIVANGIPLLDGEDIEQEVRTRRGGVMDEEEV